MTATQLVYGALRLLGVLRPGMTASTEALADGLAGLQDLVDSWQTEKNNIYNRQIVTFPLTVGQQTYMWGPGGDFSGTRPSMIEGANLLYQPAGSSLLHLPMRSLSVDEWRAVRLQAVPSPIPTQFYADGGHPNISVYFLPYPSAACSVEFYIWQVLPTFTNLTSNVVFPPGYARALRYNLAVDLAPAFGIMAKTSVNLAAIVETAKQAKAAIQGLNLDAPVMSCDPAIVGSRQGVGPNILTGYY